LLSANWAFFEITGFFRGKGQERGVIKIALPFFTTIALTALALADNNGNHYGWDKNGKAEASEIYTVPDTGHTVILLGLGLVGLFLGRRHFARA
jgi:hypothetical protein